MTDSFTLCRYVPVEYYCKGIENLVCIWSPFLLCSRRDENEVVILIECSLVFLKCWMDWYQMFNTDERRYVMKTRRQKLRGALCSHCSGSPVTWGQRVIKWLLYWQLTIKQLAGYFFFYKSVCPIITILLCESGPIQCALWILVAWCFSTRVSVTIVLRAHPHGAGCLWVNTVGSVQLKHDQICIEIMSQTHKSALNPQMIFHILRSHGIYYVSIVEKTTIMQGIGLYFPWNNIIIKSVTLFYTSIMIYGYVSIVFDNYCLCSRLDQVLNATYAHMRSLAEYF